MRLATRCLITSPEHNLNLHCLNVMEGRSRRSPSKFNRQCIIIIAQKIGTVGEIEIDEREKKIDDNDEDR